MAFMVSGFLSYNFDKIILWLFEKSICPQIIYTVVYYIPIIIPWQGLKPCADIINLKYSKKRHE